MEVFWLKGVKRMKNQKRRKRRRARKIKGMCILCLCAVVGLGLWKQMNKDMGENILAEIADVFSEEKKDYIIEAPKVLEENEIEEKLKELAGEYDEFSEVYEMRDNYPKDMLAALCNNPEMVDFVKGYFDAEKKASGEITRSELEERFPLFLQWDKRWGYASYGNSNIGMSGCAPTCLSMVIVGLTGNKDATPAQVANFAWKNGYYIEGTGTSWSLMTNGCLEYGISGREISLDKDIIFRELEQGHPVICSVRAGDFTTSGHFILLVGVEDGKIKVNDPNSTYRSKETWDYDKLREQIKNLWAFSA